MGPAIALRLRQHLTLTPQVQQALRLLQMSAMEFAQEMEQALTANPFLEENPDAPVPVSSGSSVEEVVLPHEITPGAAPADREQEDWGGVSDAQPTLQEHLKMAQDIAKKSKGTSSNGAQKTCVTAGQKDRAIRF